MSNKDFYNLLTRSHDGIAVITAFKDDGSKEFFRSNNQTELELAVERMSENSKAVYADRNLRRKDLPPGIRGADDDVTVVNAITLDCDLLSPAHKETALPKTIEEAKVPLSGYPQPTLTVHSGYGFYAEWFFREPIVLTEENRERIEGIFRGFGKAVLQSFLDKGYRLDNVFTLSHMFRAPGSYNNKLDTPVECRILENSGICYTPEDFSAYYLPPEHTDRTPFEVDERVVGSADRIMEHCLFVQKLLNDPNAVTEPEWKACGDNIALAADGAEKFHEWSSHYSGYDYDETENKIRRSQKIKRPCTCQYIRDKLCFSCPEGGCGVKAPVVFSLYTKQEQLTNLLRQEKIDDPFDNYVLSLAAYAKENAPADYGRLKQMIKKTGVGLRDFERAVRGEAEKYAEQEFGIEPREIRLAGIDLHGAMEPQGYRISLESGVEFVYLEDGLVITKTLCPEPVVITKRLENIDTGQERLVLSHYRNGRWKEIISPRSTVLNKNKLVSLSDNGLPVSTDNAEGVVRYLSSYEAANSKCIPFIRSISRIGWVGKEFYPCLTNGDIVYENDDADNTVAAITEHGDYSLWLETGKELRKHLFARAQLAASFASPLLEPLQNRVIILHIWYSSKSGKTAGLKYALSVWGDPLKLMGNFNTTSVGLERRAGTLRHLPLGIDELQALNDKRLSPSLIVYSLGNGYGKTRGAKNGGLQDVPTWRNCIVSTGEQPLAAENAMDGVNTRVLELYGAPIEDRDFGRRVHQISENHYGFGGRRYIRYLTESVLCHRGKLKTDFDEIREKIRNGTKGDPGAHLDNIAVLALADCYSSVCLFGLSEDEAADEAVSFGIAILQNTKTLEKEDIVDRAWHFTESWVAINYERFDCSFGMSYGKIEKDRVYIIASVLKQALEENGFSYTKCIRGFRDRGYIETFDNVDGKENTQCQKKIKGVNVRTVCAKISVKRAAVFDTADDPGVFSDDR